MKRLILLVFLLGAACAHFLVEPPTCPEFARLHHDKIKIRGFLLVNASSWPVPPWPEAAQTAIFAHKKTAEALVVYFLPSAFAGVAGSIEEDGFTKIGECRGEGDSFVVYERTYTASDLEGDKT